MDERAKRISEAIENSGLSYPELERITGISKSSLQRYATGVTKKIPIDCIELIAKATGTDAKYLMGWDDSAKTVTPSVSIKDAVPFDPDGMIAFPIIGRVSAGMGSYADPENVVGTMVTDADKIIDGYDYVWLRVDGDSMEPELIDGDHVLVRVQDTAETGDLAVVLVDDENGVVKRIEYEEQNHITLISNNPKYTPRVFVREEMNRIRIFGKVVKMSRSF